MRQSIRALGWASKILWIVTAAFMVTTLYSPLKLLLEKQIGIGSPQPSFSNGTITLSIPFFINNTGFYDISDLNVATSVADLNGILISESKTYVKNIPRSVSINETHAVSVSLDNVISKNLTHLLFNDSNIALDASVGLNIAYVIPLQVSTSVNMPWGAPFHNMSIRQIGFPQRYNSTHYNITARLSFENHSPFDIDGRTRLEILNERKEFIGLWVGQISAPAEGAYEEEVTMYIPSGNIFKFSGRGEVHAHIESPIGTLNWWFTYGQ